MSHGTRLVPAAQLALPYFCLSLVIAIAILPATGFASPPPLPDNRLGLRQAPLLLLSRPDVRAEVGLDPSQAADAERALTDLYLKADALKGKTGPEVLAGRRAIDEAQEEWLKTRLTEPQRKRLIEIDLQWEGPSALVSRPVVADHIGLTPDQRARLTQAIAARNRQIAQGGDARESMPQLTQQTLSLLTPEQRDRWFAMLGHHFTPQMAGTGTTRPR
jgi:hypothetical protein